MDIPVMEARQAIPLEDNCLLSFRVIKTVYQDGDCFTVRYGLKGVDEVGNDRVVIREISDSWLRARDLADHLNSRLFSQAHLLDLIDAFLYKTEGRP